MGSSEGLDSTVDTAGSSSGAGSSGSPDTRAILEYLNHIDFGSNGDYTNISGYGGDITGKSGYKPREKDTNGAAALLNAFPSQPAQSFGFSSAPAGVGDLWRDMDPYSGAQAPKGSLFTFVGQDVDPYSGQPLGSESLDPFTGTQIMDPFISSDPFSLSGRALPFDSIHRNGLLSSPNLLASNGPVAPANAPVTQGTAGTHEMCYEVANSWALVCVPAALPGQPPELPIDEVTVRGVRPNREQKLSSPPPVPDMTTQVEWAYPPPDSRLIQPITHVDTGYRPLNFVLSKIILPWRNALAFYENVALASLIGVDDALEHSPIQQEYHAAQVMLPMSKVMAIGATAEELMLGVKYTEGLLNQISFKNISTSLTFMSMGVGGPGGSLPWLRSADAPQLVEDIPVLTESALPQLSQSRLINPKAGEELYVGEWLKRNLQVKLDDTVRSFVADPHTMAALVPREIPYRAIPQYGGYVIEYGLKASVESDWLLNSIIRDVPQSSQMVRGGAPDLVLRPPFVPWNLKGWDVTTLRAAALKAARGVDYTFLEYTIDWKALGL